MDLELTGRPALVTGGSRGIGRAIARALLREGALVAVASRDPRQNEAAVAALAAETGGTVMGLIGDIARPDDGERLVAEAARAFGGLQILVNAAGRVSGDAREDVEAVEESLIRQDFEEKVLGYFRMSRAAIPYMQRAGYGRIISLSGNAARTAGAVSAGIRNAAVIHMTKTLARAYGRDNIMCHALCPAVTLTERVRERLSRQAEAEGIPYEAILAREARHHAIGRLVTADEVADVAVFLASPRSAAITGEVIAVTGGVDWAVRY
jgi:NAD(P)-dependent dehydrogenase (short-subunit alcohol dehydrogenase family)